MAVDLIGQDFSYSKAVTPSDTTDNIHGAMYIMNIGTAGVFTIRQSGSYGNVVHALAQYQSIRCGKNWKGVMSTSLGAGVSLLQFI